MCFAALLGAAGVAGSAGASTGSVISLIGSAVGAVGSLAAASAQAAAAQASADQNRNNAIIAQRNAEDALNRGNAAQQQVELRTRQRIAGQVNQFSERNISVSSGSPLDVIGDTAAFGKLDQLVTKNNATRESIAYKAQASNFNSQATIDEMTADSAMTGGAITAFSTALGGVGKFAVDNEKQMSL